MSIQPIETNEGQSRLPELTSYTARDGSKLYYRHYQADSGNVMILLHGISEDSKYLQPLAAFIASRGLANVVTPDLRGYGENPVRRGHIDYVGQIDDDLEDLLGHLAAANPRARFVMAGHSGGGGTAIRLAAKHFAERISAYLLLAPAVGPNAPTERKDTNGAVRVNMAKLVSIMMANKLGIRLFNHAVVMNNYKPPEKRHGTETLQLSYNLVLSRVPGFDFEKQLRALVQPTLLLAGDGDEVFIAEQYAPLFAKYNKADVKVVPDANHDGILSHEAVHREVESWFRRLSF